MLWICKGGDVCSGGCEHDDKQDHYVMCPTRCVYSATRIAKWIPHPDNKEVLEDTDNEVCEECAEDYLNAPAESEGEDE